MTAHLKSRNSSWKLGKTQYSNITFSNPVGCVYENDEGLFLLFRGKKTKIKKTSCMKLIDKYLKKGFYACGYMSFEFTEKKINKSNYKAIFNLYERSEIATRSARCKNINNESTLQKIQADKIFLQGVTKAKKYIQNGDIYQINLTREFSFKPPANPHDLFLKYYNEQPVDYGSYIKFDDHSVISGSMELFLEKTGNTVRTKPIKGTSKIDSQSKKQIQHDEKELAENLMIVDLMRNDLSRVCKTGSVISKKLFKKKKYATLYQLESEVEGKLKSNATINNIFGKVMPPGSVTGAPKSRALEIIKEIESHQRGPYCGAIGMLEPNGNFCFSVGIRICKITKKDSKFYTGAGIVWDSIPKKENEETILKTEAFRLALRRK